MTGFRLSLLALLMVFGLRSPAAGLEMVDDDGRTLALRPPYRRVISLYAAHTENLAAIGLDQEIIGVSGSSDLPEGFGPRPVFSAREDVEKFLAAGPDLVLVRPMLSRAHPDLMNRLREHGLAVVALQPNRIDELAPYWRKLGELTGRQVAADALVSRFEKELAAIAERVATIPAQARPKVYFEAIHAKMKTVAPESIAAFALAAAGGINVAADAESVRETNIAAYGKERILARAEEIDVFLAQRGRMNPVSQDDIASEPGFALIRAVRLGRIHLVDEEIVSRPTPRILDGIRQIAAVLHPGLLPTIPQGGHEP